MIKPGHYILRNDVVNPKCDRRTHNEFRLVPTWRKGLRIFVRADKVEFCFVDGVPTETMEVLELTPYDSHLRGWGIREKDTERRFEALTAALEPIQDGLSILKGAEESNVGPAEILDWLIENAGLEIATINTAIQNVSQENEARWEKEEAAEAAHHAVTGS